MDPVEEILNVPFKPWEYMTYSTRRFVIHPINNRRNWYKTRSHDYRAVFETLENYNKTTWKLGDVVKFGKGYYLKAIDWQAWFLNEKDFDQYLKKHKRYNKSIPAYARNQYAIVLARYKWTKYKGYMTYIDYGSFIMMLTGSKIGHIRKYYVVNPYEFIGAYPYVKMRYNLNHDRLFHGVERVKDVTHFLENLVRKIAI